MLQLKNTLDGYLKNVEVIGNTVQDTNNLADIRSVGDKVEGQELYNISIASRGKNLFDGEISISDKRVSTSNGSYYPQVGYSITKFIKVSELTDYCISTGEFCYYSFYDKNKVYITGGSSSNGRKLSSPQNAYYIRFDFRTENINTVQIEEGTQATSYEPYQEQKLEILSPVQLEKVGNVVDRIICKDGVWGVEKNVIDKLFNGSENWVLSGWAPQENTIAFKLQNTSNTNLGICDKFILNRNNSTIDTEAFNVDSVWNEISVRINKSKLSTQDVTGFKKWLSDNTVLIMYSDNTSTFTPLPHDQQVKLRTFAGQTNIAFLTEIAGQIKAQVPKSLGATVNTHTEQIAELHNSLDRVKKLEETTVSTIETGSGFTTVDATSNGYFEDVKLEGKTLVNLIPKYSKGSGLWNHSTFEADEYGYVTASANGSWLSLPRLRKSSTPIKQDTEYTLILDIKSNTLNSSFEVTSNISNDFIFREPILIDSGKSGVFIFLVKSVNDITNCTELFRSQLFHTCTEGTIVYRYSLLEGDHTNNPPEYFEGLMSVGQDVEEVIVESMNENLWSNGRVTMGTDNLIPKNANAYVYLKRGDYLLSCNYTNDSDSSTSFRFSVKRNNSTGEVISGLKGMNNTFTVNDDGIYYIAIDRASGFDGKITSGDICLVSSSNFTQHIPHQSNKKPLLYYNPTTETWEKPVLREWDTIEKHSDGKYYYHKRSGEVVFNGSEFWERISASDSQDIIGFNGGGLTTTSNNNSVICNKFPTIKAYGESANFENIFIPINTRMQIRISKSKLATQDVAGFKAWLKDNPTTVVYQLAQEEVYECTNIDLMTYSGETNYIINSGAISPKSLLKVHNNISNVVKILQEKVSLLENTFIAGLKSVLSGDMYSLATILYPEDFEQNDNTEQDIMVIPE